MPIIDITIDEIYLLLCALDDKKLGLTECMVCEEISNEYYHKRMVEFKLLEAKLEDFLPPETENEG